MSTPCLSYFDPTDKTFYLKVGDSKWTSIKGPSYQEWRAAWTKLWEVLSVVIDYQQTWATRIERYW